MPDPQHDAAALAQALPAHLIGPALSGSLSVSYAMLPGRDPDEPDLQQAREIEDAQRAGARPVAGIAAIVPGMVTSPLARPRSDDPLMRTVARPTSEDWWD